LRNEVLINIDLFHICVGCIVWVQTELEDALGISIN